jgi:transcriptional regulator with XRE-family HTH domain
MSESETFRKSLIRLRQERGLSAAELSRRAGLNVRAVTDIEERRSLSPKLATVFALARALDVAPGEMIGLGAQARINDELAEFLSRYGEEDQARLLAALHAIAPETSE